MTKYQNEIRLFVLGSLVIFSAKIFIEIFYILIFAENKFYVANVFIPLLLVLAFGQVYGIVNNKKYTWILSIIQVVLIFFTSEGTYGWLFGYVFKPFSLFHVTYSYFLSACLLISETIKTVWLYSKLG